MIFQNRLGSIQRSITGGNGIAFPFQREKGVSVETTYQRHRLVGCQQNHVRLDERKHHCWVLGADSHRVLKVEQPIMRRQRVILSANARKNSGWNLATLTGGG